MSDHNSDVGLVLGCAFGFWLLLGVPIWLLGYGLTGQFVFWPSFTPDIALLSILWLIAFYGPLLLIAFIIVDAINESRNSCTKMTGDHAED